MSSQDEADDPEKPSTVAHHPDPEVILNSFFDAWNEGDADRLMALVTEDASIHWKKLNQLMPGAKWITWSRDVLQFCADEACSVYDAYEGKKQELREFDAFCTDMRSGFKERAEERAIERENTDDGGLLLTINTKASYNKINGKVLIGLKLLGDKIKDIKIEVRC